MSLLFPWQANAWARDGSIAIARDNINSPIHIGLDEEGVRLVLQQELAGIAEAKGIPLAPLRAILAKLGESALASDRIPALLEAKADELIALRTQLCRLTNDRPEFAVVRERALALIENGEFDSARVQIARGRQAAREIREDTSEREAEFLVDEARIDLLQLDYQGAATKYLEASDLIAPFDVAGQVDYLQSSAAILTSDWSQFGNEQSLARARAILGHSATLVSRERDPLAWSEVQSNLGVVLHAQAEREGSLKPLQEAVVAFQYALEALTPESPPERRAICLHGLGHALMNLGEREDSIEQLNEAVTVLRSALTLMEQSSELWASMQNNLGNALLALGQRERSSSRVLAAVSAYQRSLEEWTRERVPLDWALVHINLGNAFQSLGVLEDRLEPLEQAVAAFRASLEKITPERNPMTWGKAMNNLGNALLELGRRERNTRRIEESVVTLRAALLPRSRVKTPAFWANTHVGLGSALYELAESKSADGWPLDSVEETLDEAIVALREALEGTGLSPEAFPVRRAAVQDSLDRTIALRDLGRTLSKVQRQP